MSTATLTPVLEKPKRRRRVFRRTKAMDYLKAVPFCSLHLVCIAALWTGVGAFDLALCGTLYFVRMFGITGAYHRYFSHRTYKTSRWFQFALAWLGCSALQKGPLWWSAHHRDHHRYSDTPEDPHSPISKSVWQSHLGWIMDPANDRTKTEKVHDLYRFPELRFLDTYHWIPGILLGVFCWWVGSWSGLVWGLFISTVLLYHGTFLVNSVCHLFGRKRYATKDESRNNLLVALLTLGEGWHNNHHHYQASANQGFFWWEIDISYYIIRALGFVGLVWDIRTPPPHKKMGPLVSEVKAAS